MVRRSLLPASDAPIKFFRWTGFKPSGPPADPAGKEKMARLTASGDIGVCASGFSGAGGREIPDGASGCLSFSCARVSGVSSAKFSSEDSSRMAPRMSISANLALTRFAKTSSLDFGMGFAFLGGRGRSSGGNFELEKSVI